MHIPRATLRILALLYGGLLLFGLLGYYVHRSLVLGVLVVGVASGFLFMRMRCPHCGSLLAKRRLKKIPWPFPVWVVPLSRRCPHCGKNVQ